MPLFRSRKPRRVASRSIALARTSFMVTRRLAPPLVSAPAGPSAGASAGAHLTGGTPPASAAAAPANSLPLAVADAPEPGGDGGGSGATTSLAARCGLILAMVPMNRSRDCTWADGEPRGGGSGSSNAERSPRSRMRLGSLSEAKNSDTPLLSLCLNFSTSGSGACKRDC